MKKIGILVLFGFIFLNASLVLADYQYKDNANNVAIPDNDDWVHSDITISNAPSGSTVKSIDVHYEIIHPYVGDLFVTLTDQEVNAQHDLWIYEGDSSDNISETETGITTFSGKTVNQTWKLWAIDSASGDSGYIDYWWIKVYYDSVPAQPNLTPYQPPGWSDKIVVSKTTGTTTDDTLYETDNIYLDWSVINNGTASVATGFYSYLYLDGSQKNWWYTTSLGQGVYDFVSDYALGKLSSGSHTLRIVTDATGIISESNESDNEYTKTIYINTLQPPDPPQPTYPPNGSTLDDTTPDLAWNFSGDVNYFQVQVDNNSDFTSSEVDVSPWYTANYTPTLTEGTWYWHVRSHGMNGLWSQYFDPPWSFTIDSTQDIVLNSPINGEDVTSNQITFDWQDVSGATRYELIVDNNPDFSSPEFSPEIYEGDITNSSYSFLSDWFPSSTYYWKVIAYDSSGYIGQAQSYFDYLPADASVNPVFMSLHRLYHSSDHDHFYTRVQEQVDIAIASGYNYEKIECYISDRKFSGSVPLMRLYRNSDHSHFYTTSITEKDQKINDGFEYEGITGYVYNSATTETVALYHLYNSSNADHFYTISQFEHDYAIANYGYQDLGIACYVSLDGKINPMSMYRPSAYVGWGINTAVGSLEISSYSHEDLSVPGINLPFEFRRFYNSNYAATDGPLGYGWIHSYYARVIDNGTVCVVQWGDGNDDYYAVSGSNYTSIEPGVFDKLEKVLDVYIVTKKDQTKYNFGIYSESDFIKEARLRSIVEKNGREIELRYDNLGRLSKIIDTAGREYNFSYTDTTAQAKIAEISDILGRKLKFEYQNGYLTGFTNARGKKTQYEYGSNSGEEHKLIKVIMPRGNVYTIGYDSSGKVQSQKEGQNPAFALSYDYQEQGKTKVVDPRGNTSYYKHDTDFRLRQFKDAQGEIAYVEYEDTSFQNSTLPTKIKDRRENYTYFTYDDNGNLLTRKNALNQTTTYTYDSKNNITSMTNGKGKTTNYRYDTYGNLTTVIDPLNHQTNITYNSYGQIETITDAENRTTTYAYLDTYKNLTEIKDGLGNKTTFSYDAVSRMISTTDANSNTTTYSYDANNNLLKITTPLNDIDYTYDENDNLSNITDARDQTVYFYYNDEDRLKQEVDALGNNKYYYYTSTGNIEKIIDFNGSTIQYSYNNNNQLERILYPDTSQVTFGYDENGNRTSMVDKNGTSTYTYDAVNRISSYTNSLLNKIVTYSYDAAGNLEKIIYPGNKTITYGYDDANRLISVSDWNNKITSYSYDKADLITSVTYPNTTKTSYNYDSAKRLINLYNRKSDQSIISSYILTPDGIGNPTQIDLQEPLSAILVGESISSSYNDANQLTSADGFSYTYDNNGNRKTRSGNGVTFNYTYDYEDMLTQYSDSSNTYQFKYDGGGDRISAIRNGTETRYLLDINGELEQILMETNSSGTPTAYYIYGLGLIYKIDASGNYYYYHYNWRGDTIAISDSAQNITNKYRYDEFGNIVNSTEGISNPFSFMGKYGCTKEIDNLVFARARYYDTKNGKFLQRDPEGYKEGINLYIYTANNPINYVDPLGRYRSIHSDYNKVKESFKEFYYEGEWYRFNKLGEFVEHSGKIIEKYPPGYTLRMVRKALKFAKHIKPRYFRFLLILDAWEQAQEFNRARNAPYGSVIIFTPLGSSKVLEPWTKEWEEFIKTRYKIILII